MAAKPSMSINLGLPAAPEVDSPELYMALVPVYNAIKNTMYAVDAYTGNSLVTQAEFSEVNSFGSLLTQKTAVFYVKLTEAMSSGTMVNFHDSGGTRARKALLPAQPAQAFSLATGSIGDTIPVCLLGMCTSIGGLTPGTPYYMSGAVAGLITPVVTAQKVGFAIGPNQLWFAPA